MEVYCEHGNEPLGSHKIWRISWLARKSYFLENSATWSWLLSVTEVRLRLKCDGTRAETRFHLSAKRTSPFKSAGASVQATTGSRGVRIGGSNAGYTMFRGSVKGTGYPLHSPVSPSPPLPCVTVCHYISTGLHLSPRVLLHTAKWKVLGSRIYVSVSVCGVRCAVFLWVQWCNQKGPAVIVPRYPLHSKFLFPKINQGIKMAWRLIKAQTIVRQIRILQLNSFPNTKQEVTVPTRSAHLHSRHEIRCHLC